MNVYINYYIVKCMPRVRAMVFKAGKIRPYNIPSVTIAEVALKIVGKLS